MASLREILALKNKQAPLPAPEASTTAAKPGIVIRPAAVATAKEQAAAALPPRAPIDIPPPEVRELGNTKPEGGVPFEFPSEKSSDAAKDWLRWRQLPQTALGIWIEPDMEGAWLAIRNEADPKRPLLIFRMKTMNEWGEKPF